MATVKVSRGILTTEFWLSALAVVLPFLGPVLEPSLSAWAQRSFVGALVAAVFTVCRTWLKRRELEAATVAADPELEAARARAAAESRASARAGEALGIPPRPTGGNTGSYASSSATSPVAAPEPVQAPGGASSSVPASSRL